MVHLRVYRVGEIPEDFVDTVRSLLSEFYDRVLTGGLKAPVLVEVYIYEDTGKMRSYMETESLEAGVSVIGLYPLSHEAWRGWPRIHIDYSMVRGMEGNTLRALLLHEAGHSVLHGGIEYYIVSANPPEELTLDEALRALYLASTAVKDLEVATLLHRLGYQGELRRYAEYQVSQASTVDCSSLLGRLELAKLLAPLMPLSGKVESLNLDDTCLNIAEYIINVMLSLRGSLDEKISRLVSELAKVRG